MKAKKKEDKTFFRFKVLKFQNGKYIAETPDLPAVHSITSSQRYTPEGAYTTFRTYHQFYVLNLEKHFDRLSETASLTGKTIQLDRRSVAHEILEMMTGVEQEDFRVRLSVDLSGSLNDIYIAMEPLDIPDADAYQSGIDVETERLKRSNPKAKVNSFLSQADQVRARRRKGLEEILMVNEKKEILEGLSSNFYAVAGGTIFTAEDGVLSGTTREYVLTLIRSLGLPIVFRPIHLLDLHSTDEAFITSTSRSILPVRRIDAIQIGDVTPGPVTKRLMNAFQQELDQNLADLRAL